jgi:hypothetical protein
VTGAAWSADATTMAHDHGANLDQIFRRLVGDHCPTSAMNIPSACRIASINSN